MYALHSEDCKDGHFSAKDCKRAGFSAKECKDAEYLHHTLSESKLTIHPASADRSEGLCIAQPRLIGVRGP